MDNFALAALLFPDVTETPADLETRYPPRSLPEGARVARMAPSPTGFMHLGNLYGAIADERLAHQSGGVFLLRIEDTDQKREVPGGVEKILEVFRDYQLPFDEGATAQGEKGSYGPYRQRQRAGIYHVCAKYLVQQSLAYPCFLTEEELAEMHHLQEELKIGYGCYGNFARYRNTNLEEIEQRIRSGQSYVIRLKSPGDLQRRIKVNDLIRGTLELPENDQDVVLLKTDGIPTYHFAHVVDDHLMRTSIVVRGEEWLATLPIHIQLFAAMGWKPPKYLHTAHLMKAESGGKRKLSKRKDPELALDFYKKKGYPVAAVKEYLLSLLNSNFEDWRKANPLAALEDFPFSAKKMGISGALFDLEKLNDVSRNVLARMSAEEVLELALACGVDFPGGFKQLLAQNEAYAIAILRIGRGGPKPRKDITTLADLPAYIGFFYDPLFRPHYAELPPSISRPLAKEILANYEDIYGGADTQEIWFGKIKAIAKNIGFAPEMKEYRENPGAFPGHVGDVIMVIRLAITGRQTSPDLYEVMQVLGTAKVKERLARMADAI